VKKTAAAKKRPTRKINVAEILPAGWIDAIRPDCREVSLGLDVGTTAKEKSNPCVLAIEQKVGHEYRFPLVIRWKSKDPEVAKAIIQAVLDGLKRLGLRGKSLNIDATSEKYFAVAMRRAFAGKIPVNLIVSSESTEYGGEKMLWKAYLGNLFTNEIETGYVALPPEEFVKIDLRSVSRVKGTFDAEVVEDGGHGDVFDACKLAHHGMVGKGGGPAEIAAVGVGSMVKQGTGRRAGIKAPFAQRGAGGRRRIV
jgi:hypothetical protein